MGIILRPLALFALSLAVTACAGASPVALYVEYQQAELRITGTGFSQYYRLTDTQLNALGSNTPARIRALQNSARSNDPEMLYQTEQYYPLAGGYTYYVFPVCGGRVRAPIPLAVSGDRQGVTLSCP